MKIHVVCNFYPPHYFGGHEVACWETVDALRARGHDVFVLTSRYGLESPVDGHNVRRSLITDLNWRNNQGPLRTPYLALRKEIVNRRELRRAVSEYRPDLIYFWGLRDISISLLPQAIAMNLPVHINVGDYYLAEWERHDIWACWLAEPPPWLVMRPIKALLLLAARLIGLKTRLAFPEIRHPQFVSAFVQNKLLESGRRISPGRVVHWGVDAEKFRERLAPARPPSRLLFVGRLDSAKGAHTAIEALAHLRRQAPEVPFTLTIVGGSTSPEYVESLKDMAKRLSITDGVAFLGHVDRDVMEPIYHRHDLLFFPSVWDEPFGITILEAMACGLAVVGTASGGSAEFMVRDENSLIFRKGDADDCARQILRLTQDPVLYRSICRNARKTAVDSFPLVKTLDLIEQSLRG